MRSIQSEEEEEGSRRELRAKEAPEIKGVETRGAGAAATPPKSPSLSFSGWPLGLPRTSVCTVRASRFAGRIAGLDLHLLSFVHQQTQT